VYLIILAGIFWAGLLESAYNQSLETIKLKKIIVWAIIFTIVAFNSWSPDYDNYRQHFESAEFGDAPRILEPGFIWVMQGLNAIGVPFQGLLVFVGLVTATCQTKVLFSISRLPFLIFACNYMLPFFPNIVQLRSFIAFSLIMMALVMQNRQIKTSIVFALLAPLFHVGVIPLLPLFLIRKSILMTSSKIYWALLGVICIVGVLLPSQDARQIMIELNPKFSTLEEYSQTPLNTFILYSPIAIANVLLILHHEKSKQKTITAPKIHERKTELIVFIKYATLTFPLVFVTRDFSRIIINFAVFAYGYLGIIAEEKPTVANSSRNALRRIGVLAFASVLFASQNLLVNGVENFQTIEKTFDSNHLFEYLLAI
jgi:hypothetical protein